MRKNFLLVGSLSFFLAATGLAHSPQNESAKYKLDRKQARTTAVLTRGTLELNVGSFDKSIGKQGSYSSQFRYQLKTIIGDLNGAKPINIPAEFFSPDFLQTLRTEKNMQLDAFKIRHLGFRDVRTRFDVSYPHSDVLYIYDIQNMMTQSFQTKLENALVDVYELEQDVSVMGLDPKDARVTLTISEAVPAMGAVTVDVSAKIKGKIIKAGFDYLPPSIPDPDFRASPDATRLAPDNT